MILHFIYFFSKLVNLMKLWLNVLGQVFSKQSTSTFHSIRIEAKLKQILMFRALIMIDQLAFRVMKATWTADCHYSKASCLFHRLSLMWCHHMANWILMFGRNLSFLEGKTTSLAYFNSLLRYLWKFYTLLIHYFGIWYFYIFNTFLYIKWIY